MSDDARLQDLRGALLAAAGADLAAAEEVRPQSRPRRRRSTRAKLAIAVVAAALAVPAGALAIRALGADHPPSLDQGAARGLPGGSMAMVAADPSCVTLRRNVEYDCLLSSPPQTVSVQGRGYVVDVVDATDHVNGGCRAENPSGTRWRCFLGEAAVRHKLIARQTLGDYRPA
jgi:hypothetical protein